MLLEVWFNKSKWSVIDIVLYMKERGKQIYKENIYDGADYFQVMLLPLTGIDNIITEFDEFDNTIIYLFGIKSQ